MHIIQTISLVFILGCLACEITSFLTNSLYESLNGNFGIFTRCSGDSCHWWDLGIFREDPAWLQFGAVASITSLGILILLFTILMCSCCVEDNSNLRYISGAVAFTNVLVLASLIALYTLQFKEGLDNRIPYLQKEMFGNINLYDAKLGLSYWLLISSISINAVATLLQFCCLPREHYDY